MDMDLFALQGQIYLGVSLGTRMSLNGPYGAERGQSRSISLSSSQLRTNSTKPYPNVPEDLVSPQGGPKWATKDHRGSSEGNSENTSPEALDLVFLGLDVLPEQALLGRRTPTSRQSGKLLLKTSDGLLQSVDFRNDGLLGGLRGWALQNRSVWAKTGQNRPNGDKGGQGNHQ